MCVWGRAGKRTSLQKYIIELVLKSEMSLWRVNKCIRWLILGCGEGEEASSARRGAVLLDCIKHGGLFSSLMRGGMFIPSAVLTHVKDNG